MRPSCAVRGASAALWLAAAGQLAGCAHQAYEGPGRPASEVAIVMVGEGVQISGVDHGWRGRVEQFDSLEVLPGKHTLRIDALRQYGGAFFKAVNLPCELEVQAGRRYWVFAEVRRMPGLAEYFHAHVYDATAPNAAFQLVGWEWKAWGREADPLPDAAAQQP